MGALMYCRQRRFDQMCRLRIDQCAPNESAGQSMIGTTSLNWSIFGRLQHLGRPCRGRSFTPLIICCSNSNPRSGYSRWGSWLAWELQV